MSKSHKSHYFPGSSHVTRSSSPNHIFINHTILSSAPITKTFSPNLYSSLLMRISINYNAEWGSRSSHSGAALVGGFLDGKILYAAEIKRRWDETRKRKLWAALIIKSRFRFLRCFFHSTFFHASLLFTAFAIFSRFRLTQRRTRNKNISRLLLHAPRVHQLLAALP